MKTPGLIAAIGAVCIALPVATAGTRAPLAPTSAGVRQDATMTFEDSTGENAAAPDTQSVVVSNNDAGLLTFQVNIPNRPAFTPDMIIDILLDTDANPGTGDPQSLGADYAIELFQGAVNLFHWDGTTFTRTGVPQTSLIFSYANGALTIKISAVELGSTKRFNFGVIATSGVVFDPNTGNTDFTNQQTDLAPDPGHGFWSYEVKITPLTLVVKKFGTVPATATAGKAFSVVLVLARSDTGAVLESVRAMCAASIGTLRLPARTHGVIDKQATCTFVIPRTAKGKTIRGTITVQFEDLTVTKSFAAKVG